MDNKKLLSSINLIKSVKLGYSDKTRKYFRTTVSSLIDKNGDELLLRLPKISIQAYKWNNLAYAERGQLLTEYFGEFLPDVLIFAIRTSTKIDFTATINVDEKKQIDHFKKVGEKEYCRKLNQDRYIELIKMKNHLLNRLREFSPSDPQATAISKKIEEYDKWIELYTRWFLDNDYDIPEKDENRRRKKKSPKYDPEEIAILYIKLLKTLGREPSQTELEDSGKHSQSTWSRALGDLSVIEKILKFVEIEAKNKSDEQEKYIHLVKTFENLKAKKSIKKSKSKEVRANYPQRDESIICPDNNIDIEKINGMTKFDIIKEISMLRPELKKEELSKYSIEELKTIFNSLT